MEKISTIINGQRYYTISQAYQSFAQNIEGQTPFNTFYKKFVKYIQLNRAEPKRIKSVKYYSASIVEDFINSYSDITRYSLATK